MNDPSPLYAHRYYAHLYVFFDRPIGPSAVLVDAQIYTSTPMDGSKWLMHVNCAEGSSYEDAERHLRHQLELNPRYLGLLDMPGMKSGA